jgi:hypothetical protein
VCGQMTILDQSVGEGSVCVHGAPIVAAGGAPPRAHLWLVYWASEVDRGLLDSCGSLLDESERRHSSRLGRPDDRQQYAAAHALLRIALSSQADAAPRDWRLQPRRPAAP